MTFNLPNPSSHLCNPRGKKLTSCLPLSNFLYCFIYFDWNSMKLPIYCVLIPGGWVLCHWDLRQYWKGCCSWRHGLFTLHEELWGWTRSLEVRHSQGKVTHSVTFNKLLLLIAVSRILILYFKNRHTVLNFDALKAPNIFLLPSWRHFHTIFWRFLYYVTHWFLFFCDYGLSNVEIL